MSVRQETHWHEHFLPDLAAEVDEVTGRYDAVEYTDGTIIVWCAERKRIVSVQADRDAAVREARRLANGGDPTIPREGFALADLEWVVLGNGSEQTHCCDTPVGPYRAWTVNGTGYVLIPPLQDRQATFHQPVGSCVEDALSVAYNDFVRRIAPFVRPARVTPEFGW